ncbi:hypothetical protein Ciccas_003986 [Cichlidogyrus casuarinus]|uniref:Uncharacterized protein n=1 Tax=Cichlidogyrus casuarinus TaxID=1844966 RepID=A0ABD2QCY3_9PLAT
MASCSSLRILYLNGNHIGLSGVIEFFTELVKSILSDQCEEETKVKASRKKKKGNKKEKDPALPISYDMFAISLQSNDVHIMDRALDVKCIEFIEYFCNYLKLAKDLQWLNFFGNEISTFGAQSIISALTERSKTIKNKKQKKVFLEITPHFSSSLYDQLIKLTGKNKPKLRLK